MTLYRQVIIFTFLLFFVLLTGTWLAKLETTRTFLLVQLESHAQDTATSLGLSITQHMSTKDMATIESMINAVFDRGYYMVVRLTDIRETVLIDRTLDVAIRDVPPWFIRWVSLETPDARANIMDGWNQAGSLYVKSHPGYAYKTLWDDVVSTTLWFMASGAFVLIGGGLGLRLLLRPLMRIEQQADAICRSQYEIQSRIPWTREFKRVVEAMNRMTHRVREMFEEQVIQAEGLRERAYSDPVTGLGNRRYFDTQVTARLDRRDSITKGILFLVKLNNLDELNRQKGFQAGDEYLKQAAMGLQEATSMYSNCVRARLTGGEFGLFLPDTPPWDAEGIAGAIMDRLGRIAAEQVLANDNIGNVGGVTYENTVTLSRLFSEADLAITMARQAGPNRWSICAITEESDDMPLGQQQWKQTLDKALDERRFTHDAQPVVMAADRKRVLHLEIFSRIILENGKILSAGIFIPLAGRLKLMSAIDRIAIEAVMKLDRNKLPVDTVAVNVSPASLGDEPFRDWLRSALKAIPAAAPRIIFEFSEYSAVKHLDWITDVSLLVRGHGHGIGLDHYGQNFCNLGYLKSIKPDYVKIDRAYTGELKEKDSDCRFFIGSLCSVAHSIDVMVIAEGVETEQQFQVLKDLNVDAVQGYIIDRPRPVGDMMQG
jgi:diguanylate cyclase (GGDEF)-like protein